MELYAYSRCVCGAVTVYDRNGIESYSCNGRKMRKYMPGVDLRQLHMYATTFACDHCVNHYGLDLCGCGSGELFGQCTNDLPECSKPMQIFGKYSHVSAKDSLIAG